MQLASLDRELGIRDEAIEMYKVALESLPDLFPALLGLAVSLISFFFINTLIDYLFFRKPCLHMPERCKVKDTSQEHMMHCRKE